MRTRSPKELSAVEKITKTTINSLGTLRNCNTHKEMFSKSWVKSQPNMDCYGTLFDWFGTKQNSICLKLLHYYLNHYSKPDSCTPYISKNYPGKKIQTNVESLARSHFKWTNCVNNLMWSNQKISDAPRREHSCTKLDIKLDFFLILQKKTCTSLL